MIRSEGLGFKSHPRYHRGQIIRFVLFFYGSGGRTSVLNHIYNPSKPPVDKGGLWQGIALHCFAIVIVTK